MDFKELHEKYLALLTENEGLRNEIKRLNVKLGVEELPVNPDDTPTNHSEPEVLENKFLQEEILNSQLTINKRSDSFEKIKLFMSFFRGRVDVYAKRWKNNKKVKY